MEITVKHRETEITIKETHSDKYKHASLSCSEQKKSIQETVIVMCEQVQKLQDAST